MKFVRTLLSPCLLMCACTTSSLFNQDNFSVDLGYGVKMDFISIPEGTFTMGHNPVEVELSPFALGKTEVTQAQWLAIMGNNPSIFVGENLPVTNVSWEDAIKFCKKLTERAHSAGYLPKNLKFSLPTEAQWEYACRAGTETLYSFGDDASLFPLYANFPDKSFLDDEPEASITFHTLSHGVFDSKGVLIRELNDGFAHTAPVGSFRPNAWGFYDMHGNVAEWCLDYYSLHRPGGKDPIRTTPGGGETGKRRVARGGSFFMAFIALFAIFPWAGLSKSNVAVGFRVALVQSPNP